MAVSFLVSVGVDRLRQLVVVLMAPPQAAMAPRKRADALSAGSLCPTMHNSDSSVTLGVGE